MADLVTIERNMPNISGDDGEAADIIQDATSDLLLPAVDRQLKKLSAKPLKSGLYLVSTPIGNLSDISIRAISILARADVVLCEDTRHSRNLLTAYGIKKKLEAYHDFSGER